MSELYPQQTVDRINDHIAEAERHLAQAEQYAYGSADTSQAFAEIARVHIKIANALRRDLYQVTVNENRVSEPCK